MLNGFYNWPWIIKFVILFTLTCLGLAALGITLDLPYGYALIILMVPLFNFGLIPLTRILGLSTYLSPMVLTFGKDVNDYQLHNVMSFDYVVNFKWSDRGRVAKKKMLTYYLEALLEIIRLIETGELPPTVTIVGNSYFFNERTASKFGFELSQASLFRVLNSVFNFLEISVLYSFTEGKLTMPKLWLVKKISISGTQLLSKKDLLLRYVKAFD